MHREPSPLSSHQSAGPGVATAHGIAFRDVDPASALDHLNEAVRAFHDAGDASGIRAAFAALVVPLDRIGRHDPAATIAGFAGGQQAAASIPELDGAVPHLREVLASDGYKMLARSGETLDQSSAVSYTLEQSVQARSVI